MYKSLKPGWISLQDFQRKYNIRENRRKDIANQLKGSKSYEKIGNIIFIVEEKGLKIIEERDNKSYIK